LTKILKQDINRAQEQLSWFDTVVLEADGVKTVGEYKEWTHEKIRPVFPHETLGSSWPPARRRRGLSAFAPVSSKTPPPTLYTIPSAASGPNNGI